MLCFPTFQFQIGAIKSDSVKFVMFRDEEFQFQIGAIKSSNWHSVNDTRDGFNSKLVRLKGEDANLIYKHTEIKFQFQIGAIKSD